MHCDLDLLTSKSIGHILASWGVCMWSFMMIGVKGKQLCAGNHFQWFMHCDLDLWPFDLKIYRAHPCLMGSLHVKLHDDRCKGKAVMRRKPFSVIYALWPWPFDLKIYRAHPCLMGSLHVKFHDDRCKGKAVMRRKPFSVIYALYVDDRRTDGQTDMVIPVYPPPPNFVAGAIKIKINAKIINTCIYFF